MLTVFTKVSVETLTLFADDYALDEIGHMKFFSRKSQLLWIHALNWLGTIKAYICSKIDAWSFLVILLTTNLNELSIMRSISPCGIEPSKMIVFQSRLFI